VFDQHLNGLLQNEPGIIKNSFRCAGLLQHLYYVLVTVHQGPLQRGPTLLIFSIRIRALVQKQVHYLSMTEE
jgi:hypothetical protein